MQNKCQLKMTEIISEKLTIFQLSSWQLSYLVLKKEVVFLRISIIVIIIIIECN